MYTSSNVGDVFCEVLVSHKKDTGDRLKEILAVAAGVAATIALFTFFPQFLFLAVVIWGLVVFFIKMQKTEYEYSFTSGDLDIDVLKGDFKRKRLLSLTIKDMEVIAPEKSHELDPYRNSGHKVIDAGAGADPGASNYVIYGSINNEKTWLIITPNEKLISNMYSYAPRIVRKY